MIKQFFGDGEHAFHLTFDLAHSFERDQRKSLYATHTAIINGEWRLADITEIIRLALIGGGADEIDAFNLVDTYVRNRPLVDSVKLAQLILDAVFFPPADPVKEEVDRVFGAVE